jgi:serine/threonine protein phosphatase PrpC
MPIDPPCPACGAPTVEGDAFCESCGAAIGGDTAGSGAPAEPVAPAPATDVPPGDHDAPSVRSHLLTPPKQSEPIDELDAGAAPTGPVCAECGGAIDEDGYCNVCGAKARTERDHWEERPTDWVGATCDKGIRHARNEDAMAAAAEPDPGSFAALVVCDGVTTAPHSDVASLRAARAARDALVTARSAQSTTSGPSARIAHWTTQLGGAVQAAQAEAAAVAAEVEPGLEPPSCTFVAVVIDRGTAVAGWVGDSRAYWLPDGAEGLQLSVDDSWATEQIQAGMPREQAEADSRCHSITRWLGADAPDPTPRCSSVPLDAPGWLLVCSDGLWNYASTPSALRALIDDVGADADPLAVSQSLVQFANGRGGQDNITAILARVPAPQP